MELKVKNNTFYLLDAGDEKRIYDTESEAVKALKTLVSTKKTLDPESVSILEVNTAGEKWEIKSVPWSKIAIGLMRGEKGGVQGS
jgi:hypothetical protein